MMYKFTAKLKFDRINKNVFFEPTNHPDKLFIVKDLTEGEIYNIKVTKGRSLKSLGKYWLICSAIGYYENLPDECIHNFLKKEYFGYKIVKNPFDNNSEIYIPSIAFDKMDEVEFKKYLTFVINKLKEIGIDVDELISEYKDVMHEE